MTKSAKALSQTRGARWLRKHRAANPVKAREIAVRWRDTHRARLAELARARRRKHPESCRQSSRRSRLRSKYGLTTQSLGVMIGKQEGLCAICSAVLDRGRHTHVDHDHASGVVRALLCNSCNLILGHAKDQPGILLNAAAYLDAHRA